MGRQNSGRWNISVAWPSGSWITTGSLNAARDLHTATLLPNGKVLAVGGASGPLSSTELYNPTNGTWTTTGALNIKRQWHTATLLTNSMVLVAGGWNSTGHLASAELYNPTNGTWTATGPQFTAQAETIVNEFDVDVTGRFFRIRQVP